MTGLLAPPGDACRSCPTPRHHQAITARAMDLAYTAATVSRAVLAPVATRPIRPQQLTPAWAAHHSIAIGRAITTCAEDPVLTAAWRAASLGARRDMLTHTAEQAAQHHTPVTAVLAPVQHLIQLAGEELARTRGVALGICPADPPMGPTAVHAQAYLARPRLPTRNALLTYAWLELAALAGVTETGHG